MRFRGLLYTLIFAFLFTACALGNTNTQPADVANTEENTIADLPVAPAEENSAELPPIPNVEFETRDAWFTPTPVDEVVLAAGQVQVFDFSAIWCGYCRQMAPVLEGLEILYGEEATFVMIDIDLDGDDAYGPFIDELNYDPRFRPGIYILAPDGAVLHSWFGPVDGHIIQEALVSAMAQYP